MQVNAETLVSETSYNNKIFNMPILENRTIIGDNIVEKPNFKK